MLDDTASVRIATAALAEARRCGHRPMAVVVVDAAAQVLASVREREASALRLDIALGKAAAAVGMGANSRTLAARAAELPVFFGAVAAAASVPFVPQTGAVLVRDAEGRVLGAVGASGGTGDEDECICIAGIALPPASDTDEGAAMITLYGSTASRAHRVLWMLKELQVPFEHVPVNFTDGSTRTPEFLAINPNGRVPALVDDGFVVVESMAINLYLARRYGGPLAPADWREEALATQWSFWVVTEIEKPLLFAAANRRLFRQPAPDEALASVGLGKLDRPLKVLDAHLAGSTYLLGERFTVADLNVATVLDLAPQCGIALDPGHA